MQKYIVDVAFTDETLKQIEVGSNDMYDAYEKAMKILLAENKGINSLEIKKKTR